MTGAQPPNGGQFYDRAGVSERYLSHRNSSTRSPNVVMEEPAFLSAMGDIENHDVLDLGCGDAKFANVVIGAGGNSYVGVDGSASMISEAQRQIDHPRVSLIHDRIEDYCGDPTSFDLVASRMALHYIIDLDTVFRHAHSTLRPGGRLIFTVVHPVITSANSSDEGPRTDHTVDRYFERGAREREWFGSTVTWHHRTIEDYVSGVQRCGFEFVAMSECEPQSALSAGRPDELERRRRVPLVLLVCAQRLSTD